MPYFDLSDGARLYYEDAGQGQPILFIHGVWMSGRFFSRQLSYFGARHRAIVVDLRGHGRSSHIHTGHTVAQYARDIRALIEGLGLRDVILAGWSMGSFVIWDYFRQFGAEHVKATVVIEETPSDFKWPDWPLGFADFKVLCDIMTALQSEADRGAFVREFIHEMHKNPPTPEDEAWMFEEIMRLPATIAASIFFDQTTQDYRPVIPQVSVPTLLCFGRDEKLIPVAGAEYLLEHLPSSRLTVFEESGHLPFLEETDALNQAIEAFVLELS